MVSSPELRIDGHRAVVRLQHPSFGTVDRQHDDEQLLSFVLQLEHEQLALDFRKVKLVTSQGLSMLVRLHARLEAQGRRLVITNLLPHVYHVFSVTSPTTLLDVRLQEVAA
jgi:anti-anti-sigma regulatory factor